MEFIDLTHIAEVFIYKGRTVLDGYVNPIELQTFPTKAKEVFLLKRGCCKEKSSSRGNFNIYKFTETGIKARK